MILWMQSSCFYQLLAKKPTYFLATLSANSSMVCNIVWFSGYSSLASYPGDPCSNPVSGIEAVPIHAQNEGPMYLRRYHRLLVTSQTFTPLAQSPCPSSSPVPYNPHSLPKCHLPRHAFHLIQCFVSNSDVQKSKVNKRANKVDPCCV